MSDDRNPVIRYVCGQVCRAVCPVCKRGGAIMRTTFEEMKQAMENHNQGFGHGWTSIRWRRK